MSVILVTGAGGYIGSTLVPMLLSEGYWVRAIDRLFFGRDRLPYHRRLEVIQEDSRCLNAGHFAGVEAVIDLVAISNDPSGELFQHATYDINWHSRARNARLAHAAGIRRYLLPSSCSIYGYLTPDRVADENSPPQPLTTYARANWQAEQRALALASERFTSVVLRQATLYGYSPRMRFDLAVNGMTYEAFTTGKLPLMRDGSQWRPMLHVRDAARAVIFMLQADAARISGQIFNVGSPWQVYQIGALGELVASAVPREVSIRWYGDPDQRSYRVGFDKIEQLGYRASLTVREGVEEICDAIQRGVTQRSDDTITLKWYQNLERWHRMVRDTAMYGGMLDIDQPECSD